MARVDVVISDLRVNLKAYIERAAAGEPVVVTDRGVPVACIVAADHEEVLDRLVREGVVTRAWDRRLASAAEAEGLAVAPGGF